jgi:hypothetical protein
VFIVGLRAIGPPEFLHFAWDGTTAKIGVKVSAANTREAIAHWLQVTIERKPVDPSALMEAELQRLTGR